MNWSLFYVKLVIKQESIPLILRSHQIWIISCPTNGYNVSLIMHNNQFNANELHNMYESKKNGERRICRCGSIH